MRRTLATVAALLAFASGLAGCNDGTGDIPPVKKSPDLGTGGKSPSASTPTAATTPDLKPVEVVKAWIEAVNLAVRSGEIDTGLALVTTDCQDCRNELQPLADLYAAGGAIRGGQATVANVKARSETGDQVLVDAAIDLAGGTTRRSSGAASSGYEPEKFIEEYTLRRVDDRWRIAKIVRLQ